jgi:hypothetical protein
MPHQWFIWKALLDLGRVQDAQRIAHTALDLWQREVANSYNCYEHFLTQSGRGAGWHQFNGLSSPVMSWFGAYYRPRRLTTGFNVWVKSSEFATANRGLRASLEVHGGMSPTVLVTLEPNRKYRVRWGGERAAFTEVLPGVLAVTLTRAVDDARWLEIDAS